MDRIDVRLSAEKLDAATAEAWVADAGAGAVVTFTGTTRNQHLGRAVLGLEYEAHGPVALKAMRALCEEAIARFGVVKAALHHRTGPVPIGDASVVIAVSAAHRGPAFDACRYLIDTLKKSVPIWKKETYADGSPPEWVGPDGQPVKF